jgi:anti-anti-sigma factor
VTVVQASPSSAAGSRHRTAADGAPSAVHRQVRPTPLEAGAAETMSFTFGVARALGTVVVTARGVIDEVGACALNHVLSDLVENQGNMTVVVDLHDVTDVDPRCLDIFVAAHHWALIRGGPLSLTGVRLRVARALAETGVDRLVKVTSDRILAVPASGAE